MTDIFHFLITVQELSESNSRTSILRPPIISKHFDRKGENSFKRKVNVGPNWQEWNNIPNLLIAIREVIIQSSEPEGKILLYYFTYPVGQVSAWKQKFHFWMLTVDNGQITESSKHIFVHVFSGGMFLHAMNRVWNISTTCPIGSSCQCNTINFF